MTGKDKALDWLAFELSRFSEKYSGNLIALTLADRLHGVEGPDRSDLCEALREWIEKGPPARTWIAVDLVDRLALPELTPILAHLRAQVLAGPPHQRFLAEQLERMIKNLQNPRTHG